MHALKNLTHAGILGVWILAGLCFTFSSLFGAVTLGAVLVFWLWFAGFAAVTSYTVTKFDTAMGALATHGIALILLNVIPRVFPLSLLRVGYDLITHR